MPDNQFINNWTSNLEYFDMLKLLASLSNLFSNSDIPFLDYRIAENVFCKYYRAFNDSRACTAYDAIINDLGIGVKTFCIGRRSTEKIAEFDEFSSSLNNLHGIELAQQIAEYRNTRIDGANRSYNVSESIYHIVGRQSNKLCIFNTPYHKIDVNSITIIRENSKGISFHDCYEKYSFLRSKSTLFKQFVLPSDYFELSVDIIDDPYSIIAQLLSNTTQETHIQGEVFHTPQLVRGYDYVILPLYSTRGRIIHVPIKSGLNQWNADGRTRNEDEVYIPVPSKIHRLFPDFFPERTQEFELHLPNNDILSAKMCQAGNKGLMSNPNSALGHYLLRTVLNKTPGELVTIEDLYLFGIDSVMITKLHQNNNIGQPIYKLTFARSNYESYSDFIEEE